jgi:Sigma-70, region 4
MSSRLSPDGLHLSELRGETPQTLQQVGIGLGITRERVRQLESRRLHHRASFPGMGTEMHDASLRPVLFVLVAVAVAIPWGLLEAGLAGIGASLGFLLYRAVMSRYR